ncbi:MAG: hypothetical protein HY579_04065 [Nitrospinae bacterium]|nr:hypothetical protein [Nitrospinota bacterium]
MSVTYQILFSAGKILFYILVVVSFVVSALILFKPALAARINERFNAVFSTEHVHNKVDKYIDTTEALLEYRWLLGGVFLAGSALTIKYLVADFDEKKFVALIINPAGLGARTIYEIVFAAVRWFFALFSGVGVVVCLTILFWPASFRKISEKMDTLFSTVEFHKALDASNHSLDNWVLRHHVIVGAFLFMGSCYLMVIFLFVLRK